MTEKKASEGMTVAVTDFLAGLRLTGSEWVLGALALALAEGIDASPAYAKGKLARELRETGAMCAMRWPSGIRNSPPPFRKRSGWASRPSSRATSSIEWLSARHNTEEPGRCYPV